MQIILASAKIMHESVQRDVEMSAPRFMSHARQFARDMMEYDTATIAGILGCSQQIAAANRLRYAEMCEASPAEIPAILAYNGQAYKHLKASTLNAADIEYAQRHLWIMSFMYGMLRPLDGIYPYRMEGKVELPGTGGKTLFDFWKPQLTDLIIDSTKADDGTLIHLATEEFQHLFDWRRVENELNVVQPLFYVRKGTALKMQAVWAKSCRGAMTRFIIENRITTPDELRAFSYEGFEYNPRYGDDSHPHFIRE